MGTTKQVAQLLLLACSLQLCGYRLGAQGSKDDGAIHIVFHVTSVTQDVPPDWCTTGECAAARFTVEGYSRVQNDAHYTQFVLKCIEVTAMSPTPHVTMACARLRANANYDTRLFADVLFFVDHGKQPETADAPPEAAFEIVSQREVRADGRVVHR